MQIGYLIENEKYCLMEFFIDTGVFITEDNTSPSIIHSPFSQKFVHCI